MGEFSLTHILLVAMIALVLFGPNKLPQLGKGLGKAIRGFKEGLNEIEVDAKDISDDITSKRSTNTKTTESLAAAKPAAPAATQADPALAATEREKQKS